MHNHVRRSPPRTAGPQKGADRPAPAADEPREPAGPLGRLVANWQTLRPDLEPTTFSILMHLGHLSIAFGRVLQGVAEEFGIGQSDVRLLMAIKRDQGGVPVRPSELSARLALTRATITYRVDRLLDLGLAERIADPTDRRALFVRLTPRGEEVLGTVMSRYAAVAETKFADVDEMEGGRAALERRLIAIARRFEPEWPMDPNKAGADDRVTVDHLAGAAS